MFWWASMLIESHLCVYMFTLIEATEHLIAIWCKFGCRFGEFVSFPIWLGVSCVTISQWYIKSFYVRPRKCAFQNGSFPNWLINCYLVTLRNSSSWFILFDNLNRGAWKFEKLLINWNLSEIRSKKKSNSPSKRIE